MSVLHHTSSFKHKTSTKVRQKKDPCLAIAWQQSGPTYHIVKNYSCKNEHHRKIQLTILGEANNNSNIITLHLQNSLLSHCY
jgi:hypothetical protein